MKNTKPVKHFIHAIASENYAEAKSHLEKVIESKLKEKIQKLETERNLSSKDK